MLNSETLIYIINELKDIKLESYSSKTCFI